MSRLRTLEKDREPTGWQLLWRIKETRQAILITVGLLIVYRVLLNIPLPGVSTTPDFIRQNIPPGSGLFNLLEFLSMLSGSSLLRVSALALGLLPYNVASALIYSSVQIIPGLRRMVEEDPRSARDRFERWNYYLAVPVAFFEAYLFLFVISPNCEGRLLILEGGAEKADALFVFTTMLILVTGSFVAVWISGLISEYGIQGQGNVILIATGIIGQIPNEIARLLGVQVQSEATVEFMGLVQKIPDAIRLLFVTPGKLETFIAYIILFVVCVIAIIYLLSGKRYIPVAYPDKRLNFRPFSRSMKFGARSTLPLSLTTGSDGFIGSQLLVAITSLYAPLATCSESLRINAIAKQVISVFGDKSVLFGPLAFFSVIFFTYFFCQHDVPTTESWRAPFS